MSAGARPGGATRPERLLVITSVPHVRHEGRLHAYGPYVRELEVWAELFPTLTVAAPVREGRPDGDALPLPRAVAIVAQREVGGTTLGAKLAALLALPRLALDLARAARGHDAVQVRCPGNLGLVGALVAPLLGRPRIAKYAGQWGAFPGEAASVRFQRWVLASRWWDAPVLAYADAEPASPRVVPFFSTALDEAQLPRAAAAARRRADDGAAAPPRALYVGRLTAEKNVHVLLDALAELARAGLRVPCRIVGDGPARGALEARAASHGLADVVTFVGGVPFERVLAEYEAADVLVLPSQTEGWPKTLAEGMAFGLACVGPARGVVPGMLADGRGLTVPPRDVPALAAALRAVLAGPDGASRRRDLAARASAWASRFTRARFRDDLRQVLAAHWDGASARAGVGGAPVVASR